VLVDVERWPQWTPSMTEVRLIDVNQLRESTRVRVRQPGLPPLTWPDFQSFLEGVASSCAGAPPTIVGEGGVPVPDWCPT
jgi:hypothetical protein